MLMVALAPEDLGGLLTMITGFMCHPSTSYQTYHRLLATYYTCRDDWAPDDASNDLRITAFIRDMKAGAWRDDIVVGLGIWDDHMLVVDGIHRGVAYLACLADDVSPERLPSLLLAY